VVLNVVISLPALLFTPGFSIADKLTSMAGLLGFAACLVMGSLWRKYPVALDVAWALMLLILLRSADPLQALGVIYVGIYVRGLRGRLAQLMVVVAVLAGVYSFETIHQPGTPAFQIGNTVGFLGTAIVARAIGISLDTGERMLRAQRAMGAATNHLITSADEAALVRNTEFAVLQIAPELSQVVVRLGDTGNAADHGFELADWIKLQIDGGDRGGGYIAVPAASSQQATIEALAATVGLCLEKITLEEKLRTESTAKSQFLAAMSHELRTPLNSVLGFAQLIEAVAPEGLNDKQLRYLHNIRTNGEHLLSLIVDILDLAKASANEISLKLELLVTAEVVDRALVKVRPLAEAKSLRLRSSVRGGSVYADALRLEQVLLNLLSNAVKFTPDGGSISVSVDQCDGMVAISVEDTGVGLAAADQEIIFEAFVQAEVGRSRGIEGAGLGLSLAKRLVEAMNGRISLTSEPGKGSVFTVALPVDARGADGQPSAA
jgi:signal transduction histidine kinase